MSEILREAIDREIERHGGLRSAARALKCDAAYLSRLRAGTKDNPGEALLRKLNLRRVVTITYLPRKVKP